MFYTRSLILLFLFTFACSAPPARQVQVVAEKSVTFAVTGDIMVHDSQLAAAWNENCQCYDFKPVFAEVKARLQEADLAIGNLETTLPGQKEKYSGYPQFGAPDELAQALADSGFDLLTTANNHCVDKGAEGLQRTISVLDQLGIAHLGTSAGSSQKNRILLKEVKGMKMAFLDYTYGTNGIRVPDHVYVNLIDKKTIAEDLALARRAKPDLIILLYHFGTEYLRQPDDFQKEMTRFAFAEGADIVLGGHPHVLQPYEIKKMTDRFGVTKNRLVIYSLGNFVSGQQRRYTDGGIVFRFQVKKNMGKIPEFSQIDYLPVWVYRQSPEKDKPKSPGSFQILPVENYITTGFEKKAMAEQLPAESYEKMLLFYQDLQSLYEPSRVQTADFLLSPALADNNPNRQSREN